MRDVTISKKRLTDGSTRYRLRQELAPDPLTGKRQWHSETVRTLAEAKRRRTELLIDPATRDLRMPLATYIKTRWWPAYERLVSPSTLRQRRVLIERWLIPYLGSVPLGDLTPLVIEERLRAVQDAGCSAGRARNLVTVLSMILSAAVREGTLPSNPSTDVRVPRLPPKSEKVIWTEAQTRWFLAQQDGLWGILWATIAGTGMRIAEVRALHWRDVSLSERVIAVRYTWARGDEGEYLSSPKTKAGRREVVIPEELVEPLALWQSEQRKHAWANGLLADGDTLVFCREDLSPLPEMTVTYRWKADVTRAGLPFTTPHGLRHFAATQQINAGVPLKIVSERLGHSSIGLTANLYGHVQREHQEQAARALGRVLRQARVPDVTPIKRKGRKTA